jgi:hypothetical protein
LRPGGTSTSTIVALFHNETSRDGFALVNVLCSKLKMAGFFFFGRGNDRCVVFTVCRSDPCLLLCFGIVGDEKLLELVLGIVIVHLHVRFTY